jgi:hypothetical protein
MYFLEPSSKSYTHRLAGHWNVNELEVEIN